MAREIEQRVGCEVRILNAGKLPFIWDTPTKTDKEDAMKLAHLIEELREAIEILKGQEREEAEWLLKHLELYEQRIKELKDRMNREAKV